MDDSEDWFNRRPLRLERLFTKLRPFYFVTFNTCCETLKSYAEQWEYVRMNPVRAGLCRQPEDWPYQGEIVRIEY